MAAARFSQDVLEEFFGEIPRRESELAGEPLSSVLSAQRPFYRLQHGEDSFEAPGQQEEAVLADYWKPAQWKPDQWKTAPYKKQITFEQLLNFKWGAQFFCRG